MSVSFSLSAGDRKCTWPFLWPILGLNVHVHVFIVFELDQIDFVTEITWSLFGFASWSCFIGFVCDFQPVLRMWSHMHLPNLQPNFHFPNGFEYIAEVAASLLMTRVNPMTRNGIHSLYASNIGRRSKTIVECWTGKFYSSSHSNSDFRSWILPSSGIRPINFESTCRPRGATTLSETHRLWLDAIFITSCSRICTEARNQFCCRGFCFVSCQ